MNPARGADDPSVPLSKIEHRVLACDKGKVAIFNAKGEVEWEFSNLGECHDVWMLPNGNVLTTVNSTAVVEITPDKKIGSRLRGQAEGRLSRSS